MFEKASRLKLRFTTAKGAVTVEDLWDLPLTEGQVNLDDIARRLFKKLQEDDVSFVVQNRRANDHTQLMFDIVKRVIEVRLNDRAAADQAMANREKREKILKIIADKNDQALASASVEDLQKMLAAL